MGHGPCQTAVEFPASVIGERDGDGSPVGFAAGGSIDEPCAFESIEQHGDPAARQVRELDELFGSGPLGFGRSAQHEESQSWCWFVLVDVRQGSVQVCAQSGEELELFERCRRRPGRGIRRANDRIDQRARALHQSGLCDDRPPDRVSEGVHQFVPTRTQGHECTSSVAVALAVGPVDELLGLEPVEEVGQAPAGQSGLLAQRPRPLRPGQAQCREDEEVGVRHQPGEVRIGEHPAELMGEFARCDDDLSHRPHDVRRHTHRLAAIHEASVLTASFDPFQQVV